MSLVSQCPQTFYPLAHARAIALQNQAEDEDGWTYTACLIDATRDYASVLVYDEDGDFVGYL